MSLLENIIKTHCEQPFSSLCSHRGKDQGARWRSLLTAQAKLSFISSQLSSGYGNTQSFFWGDQWFTSFLLPAGGPYSDCGFVVTSALVQSHNYFHVSLPFRCKLLSKGAINCSGWRCFLPSRLPHLENKVNISQYDNGSCCKRMVNSWLKTIR